MQWLVNNRPVVFSAQETVRVRVTLQLTVSQSVRLGVEPDLGLLTRDAQETMEHDCL
jgi:hypothetical protein